MSTSIEVLPCNLTEKELLEKGSELAKIIRQMEEEKAAAAASAASSRETLKELEGELRRVARIVREAREDRDVEVITRRDLSSLTVISYRADTMETLRERPMTLEERQIPLAFVPREADEEDAEAGS